jgi:hypothetical protein
MPGVAGAFVSLCETHLKISASNVIMSLSLHQLGFLFFVETSVLNRDTFATSRTTLCSKAEFYKEGRGNDWLQSPGVEIRQQPKRRRMPTQPTGLIS